MLKKILTLGLLSGAFARAQETEVNTSCLSFQNSYTSQEIVNSTGSLQSNIKRRRNKNRIGFTINSTEQRIFLCFIAFPFVAAAACSLTETDPENQADNRENLSWMNITGSNRENLANPQEGYEYN